jgi:hypothetical protein
LQGGVSVNRWIEEEDEAAAEEEAEEEANEGRRKSHQFVKSQTCFVVFVVVDFVATAGKHRNHTRTHHLQNCNNHNEEYL